MWHRHADLCCANIQLMLLPFPCCLALSHAISAPAWPGLLHYKLNPPILARAFHPFMKALATILEHIPVSEDCLHLPCQPTPVSSVFPSWKEDSITQTFLLLLEVKY